MCVYTCMYISIYVYVSGISKRGFSRYGVLHFYGWILLEYVFMNPHLRMPEYQRAADVDAW